MGNTSATRRSCEKNPLKLKSSIFLKLLFMQRNRWELRETSVRRLRRYLQRRSDVQPAQSATWSHAQEAQVQKPPCHDWWRVKIIFIKQESFLPPGCSVEICEDGGKLLMAAATSPVPVDQKCAQLQIKTWSVFTCSIVPLAKVSSWDSSLFQGLPVF